MSEPPIAPYAAESVLGCREFEYGAPGANHPMELWTGLGVFGPQENK